VRNLLLEVRNVRRCEGGHTCNLVANGRKVAFIGPDIFEWSSHSVKVDVIEWFAAKRGMKIEPPKPERLKDGWESKVPEYKHDEKEQQVEKAILKWTGFYVKAYEIKERCKKFAVAISSHAEIYQWPVSVKSLERYGLTANMKNEGLHLANDLSMEEIAKMLEASLNNGASAKIVEL
jgi:hypothetical protein